MGIFSTTWHWAASGFLFGLIMLLVNYFGGYFGLSGSYRTICSMAGLGRMSGLFSFNWKTEIWHLVFIAGIILGGVFIHYANTGSPEAVRNYIPSNLFSSDNPVAVCVLFLGSVLSGFGARYAGGCTSGHLVSGISSLQMPSFIVLVFFFAGGVLTSNFIMPFLNYL